MKKNKLLIIITFWISFFAVTSCNDEESIIPIEHVELSESAILLGVGEIQALLASTTPEHAQGDVIAWSSGDPSIAEVQADVEGLVAGVQGVALGQTTLTAITTAGEITQTVDVQVITKVESILLEEVPLPGESETSYKVIFTPEEATIQGVSWSTSDPSIAVVDENGKVTAVGSGENGSPVTCIITATTEEGEKTTSVEITVSNDPPIIGVLYCTVGGTGAYNTESVSTSGADANINYSGDQPAGNYEHYEGEVLIVQPGNSFKLSLVQSNNWSRSLVWIDWNGDKDFTDEGELAAIFGAESQLNDGPFQASIDIPESTLPGLIRMRVLTGDAWTTSDAIIPCGDIPNSTTKDFSIEIGGIAYCQVSGTGAYNSDEVTTTGGEININYAGSQPSGNYEHFTDETLTIHQGGSFNLSLVQSNNWSISVVWVDWNADGDFEDNDELVQVFGLPEQLNDGPFNAQIDVPASATIGNTRMRILTGDAWTTDSTAIPCGEISNSATKDLNVTIQ
ncbi:MAG: GEVED domain-containing protein [Cytophagales bacterium]|nr:GEVED domain-containing protein [Cytophagales bacterium]